MIKWLFKWLFRLFLLAVVLVVIFFLSLDSMLCVYVEHRLHTGTGMDAEIGNFSLSFAKPTVTIKNFKVYNPPGFGGTLFLDVPEIHVEYDPVALKRHQLHIRLLRVNFAELDVVKNQDGQTNIFSIIDIASLKKTGGAGLVSRFSRQTGLEFTGIDELNVSIGKVRFIDLKDPQNNREQTIGIENMLVKDVKSPVDLVGLAVYVVLKSNGFFDSLVDQKNPGPELLKLIGQ